MDALVYISAAALVFVIVMVFVNARRVSDLRSDVENIPQPEGYTYRDSTIETHRDGYLSPKKYYWVKIAKVDQSKTPDKNGHHPAMLTLAPSFGNANTDNAEFTKDVINFRILAIYRPENNEKMIIVPVPNRETKAVQIMIVRDKNSRNMFDSIPVDGRICTIVGLPADPKNIGKQT